MQAASPALMRYQTFSARFWAGMIDGLILFPIGIIDALIFTQKIMWLTLLWIPFSYSAYWIYSVICHGRYGKTVGKHLMKIAVVDNVTESRITWKQAILRDSFFILVNSIAVIADVYVIANGIKEVSGPLVAVSLMLTYGPTIWFLTEVITCLTNHKRRALHDFIAGTVVVRTKG